MAEWLYKATNKKVNVASTTKLAVQDGFLCRSAFTKRGPRIAHTRRVKFGDLIHFYYSEKGQVSTLGTFEVIRRDVHPHPTRFGALVSETNLFEVVDTAFDKELRSLNGDEGYKPDPVRGVITGWLLSQRTDIPTPPYDASRFPPKTSLVPR